MRSTHAKGKYVSVRCIITVKPLLSGTRPDLPSSTLLLSGIQVCEINSCKGRIGEQTNSPHTQSPLQELLFVRPLCSLLLQFCIPWLVLGFSRLRVLAHFVKKENGQNTRVVRDTNDTRDIRILGAPRVSSKCRATLVFCLIPQFFAEICKYYSQSPLSRNKQRL